MVDLFFLRSASFRAESSDFHRLPASQEIVSKKKVITSLADACETLKLHLTGRCAAKDDQPLSCASRQKSLGTTALEFKIIIILTPHLVPPAFVFRTNKGYRYPRLRTPVLGYPMLFF